ncbi:hypothetical protein Bbelb_246480 [Branchiostoma belcheri]|nr:hypothetical protein Bbelb_246480 [Branchiostoma belcheri]
MAKSGNERGFFSEIRALPERVLQNGVVPRAPDSYGDGRRVYARAFGPCVARPRLTASYPGSQTSSRFPSAAKSLSPAYLGLALKLSPSLVLKAIPTLCHPLSLRSVGRRDYARVRALGRPSPTYGLLSYPSLAYRCGRVDPEGTWPARCQSGGVRRAADGEFTRARSGLGEPVPDSRPPSLCLVEAADLSRAQLACFADLWGGGVNFVRGVMRVLQPREVKPSGYSALAGSGGFAPLVRTERIAGRESGTGYPRPEGARVNSPPVAF